MKLRQLLIPSALGSLAMVGVVRLQPGSAAQQPPDAAIEGYLTGSLRWPVLDMPTTAPTQSLLLKLDAQGDPWVMLYEFNADAPAGAGRAVRLMRVAADAWQLAARLDPTTRTWVKISQQAWQALEADASVLPLSADIGAMPQDPRPAAEIRRVATAVACEVQADALLFQWSPDWRFLAETGTTRRGPDDPASDRANVGMPLHTIIVDRISHTTTVWKLPGAGTFLEVTLLGWSEDSTIYAASVWSPGQQSIWFVHPLIDKPASPAPVREEAKEPQR